MDRESLFDVSREIVKFLDQGETYLNWTPLPNDITLSTEEQLKSAALGSFLNNSIPTTELSPVFEEHLSQLQDDYQLMGLFEKPEDIGVEVDFKRSTEGEVQFECYALNQLHFK